VEYVYEFCIVISDDAVCIRYQHTLLELSAENLKTEVADIAYVPFVGRDNVSHVCTTAYNCSRRDDGSCMSCAKVISTYTYGDDDIWTVFGGDVSVARSYLSFAQGLRDTVSLITEHFRIQFCDARCGHRIRSSIITMHLYLTTSCTKTRQQSSRRVSEEVSKAVTSRSQSKYHEPEAELVNNLYVDVFFL
jgi:hypothetical protein